MEDDDFGDDVLYGSLDLGVAAESGNVESKKSWSTENTADNDTEAKQDEDDLYGSVSEKTPKKEGTEEGDDDDDEDDIAIVLNDSKTTSARQTLRFTQGQNRYVRTAPTATATDATSPTSLATTIVPDLNIPLSDLVLPGGRKTAFDVDIDKLEETPWRKPGIDVSDYFNYGFDETTWRTYASKQNKIRRDIAIMKAQEAAARKSALSRLAADQAAKAAATGASAVTTNPQWGPAATTYNNTESRRDDKSGDDDDDNTRHRSSKHRSSRHRSRSDSRERSKRTSSRRDDDKSRSRRHRDDDEDKSRSRRRRRGDDDDDRSRERSRRGESSDRDRKRRRR